MSLQLQSYLNMRAAGVSVEDASFRSNIGIREAQLTEKAIESGELALPTHVHAHTRGDQSMREEPFMARDNEVERATGGTVAADEVRLLVERVENVEEEIKGLNDDKKDIYAEAKSRGYDTKTLKRIVRLRAMDANARREAAALLETYARAVNLQDALPL